MAAALGGCSTVGRDGRDSTPPTTGLAYIPAPTQTRNMLAAIPPPQRPIAVAVYNFIDQTGQFKPTDSGTQTLSRAISQGSGAILIKALQDAGGRQWFTIVEREQLKNLLSERQIIRDMRMRYLGEKDLNPEALPSLLFAGVLLEGGVIGYDSSTVTGGAGAQFLGIGGHETYRQDTVTVYLRAVSVRTGEVLTSVTASKTIASKALDGNVFKFVAFKKLLEAEAGYTTNEPEEVALQQAIEKAVYGLVMEGVELKLWNFNDPKAGWPLLWRYQQERDGVFSPRQVQQATKRDGKTPFMVKRAAVKNASTAAQATSTPAQSAIAEQTSATSSTDAATEQGAAMFTNSTSTIGDAGK